MITKKATPRKAKTRKAASKPPTDWLGRPIKRATKSERSTSGLHPPKARRSTTASASTRARNKSKAK